MKVTHQNIEISYNENTNLWEFTLRGRERTASSLRLAKDAIEKPAPVGEKEKFEPIKGWLISWHEEPEEVTVTSIAQKYGSFYVRCKRPGRNGATLESADKFFPLSEHNTMIVDEIRKTNREIEALDKKHDRLREKLTHHKFPTTQ